MVTLSRRLWVVTPPAPCIWHIQGKVIIKRNKHQCTGFLRVGDIVFFSSFCSDPLLNLPLLPLRSIKKRKQNTGVFFRFYYKKNQCFDQKEHINKTKYLEGQPSIAVLSATHLVLFAATFRGHMCSSYVLSPKLCFLGRVTSSVCNPLSHKVKGKAVIRHLWQSNGA